MNRYKSDPLVIARSCDRLTLALRAPGVLKGPARDGVERVTQWGMHWLVTGNPKHQRYVLAASADLLRLLLNGPVTPLARGPVALALRVADQVRNGLGDW